MRISGADKVAKASQGIDQRNWRTWMDIYFDISTNTVMTEEDRNGLADTSHTYGVTQLIRPNTAEEVEDAVRRWLSM